MKTKMCSKENVTEIMLMISKSKKMKKSQEINIKKKMYLLCDI